MPDWDIVCHPPPHTIATVPAPFPVALFSRATSRGCFYCLYMATSVVLGQKKDRPISGRVKEIAEFMLHLVMENVVGWKLKEGAMVERKY